ncbi:MAG: NIPSNAP family protein [Bacteroidales bacterium]|nr:NIPSNAP family protein [Bacteroidales bacterium]
MKSNLNIKVSGQKLSLKFILCLAVIILSNQAVGRDIYQIKIYSLENEQQEMRMDKYLKDAYIPALHRAGIRNVGVFKPVKDDDKAGNLIFVLIPYQTIDEFEQLGTLLNNDEQYQIDGKDYINAAFDDAPYKRIESILLRAFKSMPIYGIPDHSTSPSDRVYELRSYQAATEKLYEKKVEMFTDGGESKIFVDLGFQPIFFGEVLSGSSMPNLMYLTTFKNKESQEKHWNEFRASPAWISLKEDEQYDNTVSEIEKYNLQPTDYSEL